jgi:hypothetical protein
MISGNNDDRLINTILAAQLANRDLPHVVFPASHGLMLELR